MRATILRLPLQNMVLKIKQKHLIETERKKKMTALQIRITYSGKEVTFFLRFSVTKFMALLN